MLFVDVFKDNVFEIIEKCQNKSTTFNLVSIKNYINKFTDLIQVHEKLVIFIKIALNILSNVC